jgi:hypothetical protein
MDSARISLRSASSFRTLALAALVCVLGSCPASAHAEAPSVDAYAGQALVLGKPHRHPGDQSGGEHSRSGELSGGATGGRVGPTSQSAGASGNPSGSVGSRSGAGSGSTAPSVGGRSAPAGGRSSASPRAPGSPRRSGGTQGRGISVQPAENSLPLGDVDIAVLALAVLLVASAALALRRVRPSA